MSNQIKDPIISKAAAYYFYSKNNENIKLNTNEFDNLFQREVE